MESQDNAGQKVVYYSRFDTGLDYWRLEYEYIYIHECALKKYLCTSLNSKVAAECEQSLSDVFVSDSYENERKSFVGVIIEYLLLTGSADKERSKLCAELEAYCLFYGYKIINSSAFRIFVDKFVEEYKETEKTAMEYNEFSKKLEIERRHKNHEETKQESEDLKEGDASENEERSTRFIFTKSFVTPLFVAVESKATNEKTVKLQRVNVCPYDVLSIDFLRAAFNCIDFNLKCNPRTENYFIMGNFATIILQVLLIPM